MQEYPRAMKQKSQPLGEQRFDPAKSVLRRSGIPGLAVKMLFYFFIMLTNIKYGNNNHHLPPDVRKVPNIAAFKSRHKNTPF